MSGTVLNVAYQVQARLFWRVSKFGIHELANVTDHIQVFPLVQPSDVVGFSGLTSMKNHVQGFAMVLHIKPVSNLQAISIDR